MNTVEQIEAAVRKLGAEEQYQLADRLKDVLWAAWDRQIEQDAASGRLDHIISEVEADIAADRTRPLDELLDDS